MAGDDELTARAALSEMQLRIAEGPHSALGVDTSATPEDVRAAFLALTKQYHPARFGRMSNEIQRLSNEVFLGIKGAHDQLQKSLGGSIRGGFPHQSGAIPVQAEGTERGVGMQKRTGQVPFGGPAAPGQRGPQFRTQLGTPAPSQQPTQPLARGTDRAGTPPPAGQRPSAPQVTPPAGTQRISSPAISRTTTPSIPRTTTPIGTPPRPGTPPSGIPAQRTTPAMGIPIQQRPTTPSPAAPGAPPRPSTPQPTAPRPGAPAAAPRPGTPPSAAPPRPSSDLNPGTLRFSGAAAAPAPGAQPPTAKQTAAAAFDTRSALRECMMLLNDQKWTEARAALNNLAAKVPQSKSYRALLYYARGREAHAAGQLDDARLEYQQALQLDPDLDLAKQAIAELTQRR